MADPIKNQLIAAWSSDLPDGIKNFLDAEIPEPPTVSLPTDTDTAILVNGICAHYILELFRPLTGLKLINIPLYIGQLNTVNQGMLLAALEYKSESNAQQDFEITAPTAGTAYQPGNLRLSATGKNGTLRQMAVEIEGQAPIALASDDGSTFYGYARFEETDLGEFTATFSGLYDDDTTVTASVNFSIDTEAEASADGADWWSVELKKLAYDTAVNAISGLAEIGQSVLDNILGYASNVVSAGASVLSSIGASVSGYDDSVTNAIAQVGAHSRGLKSPDLKSRGDLDPAIVLDEDLLLELADLTAAVEAYFSAAYNYYFKNNTHPSGGYTSCPSALVGASSAMNEKYGPGSVSWEGM